MGGIEKKKSTSRSNRISIAYISKDFKWPSMLLQNVFVFKETLLDPPVSVWAREDKNPF